MKGMRTPVFYSGYVIALVTAFFWFMPVDVFAASNINPNEPEHWAWNDVIGWIDFCIKGSDGTCNAGYYCTAGSTSATQNPCGAGKYCPAGSSGTTNCAAGYYGSSTTNFVSTCNGVCDVGYYCSNTTNVYSAGDGQCTAGYYCAAGSTSATQSACGNGYYCASGTTEATACASNSGTANTTSGVAIDCHCILDYYDLDGDSDGRSCSFVENGYYSLNLTDTRVACNNKPLNSAYNSSGDGVNNCGFACTM